MPSRVLTLANQITILRLIFVPVFVLLVIDQSYRAALAVLICAALSDVVDGTVARVFHQESPIGVALDPIADKILMMGGYLSLAFRDVLPWWLTILVISRDLAIVLTALLISLVAGYRPFRPTLLGKASTTTQVITLFVAVSYAAQVPQIGHTAVHFFTYLAATLTAVSGIHYLIFVRQRYEGPPAGESAGSTERRT